MKKIQLLQFITVFGLVFLSGCSNNDAQNQFEAQAYSTPFNVTETDFQGNVVRLDSDDWRISPIYLNLIAVEPVYPNPVLYGNDLVMEVYVNSTPISSIIQVYYFNQINSNPIFLQSENIIDDFDILTVQISTQQFGSTGEIARGIHRILLFDGSQRMITYGDILIE